LNNPEWCIKGELVASDTGSLPSGNLGMFVISVAPWSPLAPKIPKKALSRPSGLLDRTNGALPLHKETRGHVPDPGGHQISGSP